MTKNQPQVRSLLRADATTELTDLDPRSTPGIASSKSIGRQAMATGSSTLAELQERFWAASREGDHRRVLLVLQGMDTAGKGGVVGHVLSTVNPSGVAVKAFKSPTPEELRHDFLWRIRQALPDAGQIGVFDRSHYEDVLVVRVHNLVPPEVWQGRYDVINDFEAEQTAQGVNIIKVMLHISSAEQKRRLAARLASPDKYWKYNPKDVDERQSWDSYQEAYQAAIQRCSTDVAPWYVVPADRKWYARWAVQQLLIETLRELNPQWPPPAFDVAAERARLAAT